MSSLFKSGFLFTRVVAGDDPGNLGDTAAIDPLIEAVVDPRNTEEQGGRDWARWGAVKSLVKIIGHDFGADTWKWRQQHATAK